MVKDKAINLETGQVVQYTPTGAVDMNGASVMGGWDDNGNPVWSTPTIETAVYPHPELNWNAESLDYVPWSYLTPQQSNLRWEMLYGDNGAYAKLARPMTVDASRGYEKPLEQTYPEFDALSLGIGPKNLYNAFKTIGKQAYNKLALPYAIREATGDSRNSALDAIRRTFNNSAAGQKFLLDTYNTQYRAVMDYINSPLYKSYLLSLYQLTDKDVKNIIQGQTNGLVKYSRNAEFKDRSFLGKGTNAMTGNVDSNRNILKQRGPTIFMYDGLSKKEIQEAMRHELLHYANYGLYEKSGYLGRVYGEDAGKDFWNKIRRNYSRNDDTDFSTLADQFDKVYLENPDEARVRAMMYRMAHAENPAKYRMSLSNDQIHDLIKNDESSSLRDIAHYKDPSTLISRLPVALPIGIGVGLTYNRNDLNRKR